MSVSWRDWIGIGPEPVRISDVRRSHADALAAIHAGSFARPWSADEFECFLDDPAVQVDGLFLGRRPDPLGFAVSRVALDEAEVLSLALARPARGHGHSRTLLAHHLGALRHRGVAAVHLEVEEGNGPALALYRRMGFLQSGVRPGYYLRPDGTRAAALSMTRRLAQRSGQPGPEPA